MQQQAEDMDFGDPAFNDTEADIMGAFDEPQDTDAEALTEEDIEAEPAADTAPQDGAGAGEDGADEPSERPEPARTNGHDGSRPRADADGNLLDANGKIIATAGRERRIFEQNDRLKRHVSHLEQQVQQLQNNAQQIDQIAGMPAQHGLSPQDVNAGMRIMSEFKRDPMAVAKWALQETLALGYNLKQIVGDGAGGIEMQAIAKMIDDRVGPVVQKTQQQTEQERARDVATQQYNAFMAKHDYADVHEDALAAMIKQNDQLTPETAYWQLREYAARHQLDFTQPLGPQMQQRQQPAPARHVSQPQPQPQQRPSAPMPAGVAPAAAPQTQNPFADPNSDWEDIIADSMRAAGMQ